MDFSGTFLVLNLFNKYILCVALGLNGDCSRHSTPTSKRHRSCHHTLTDFRFLF